MWQGPGKAHAEAIVLMNYAVPSEDPPRRRSRQPPQIQLWCCCLIVELEVDVAGSEHENIGM